MDIKHLGRGFRPIDLPSNWISVHPGLTPNAVNLIHKHCKIITDKFAYKILKGEIVWNGFIWLPLDILVSPIAVLYYFYARFVLAKTFLQILIVIYVDSA